MKILIFGGSGIISSEVVELAISKGHEVVLVNRGRRKAFIHPHAKNTVADMQKEPLDALRQKINSPCDVVIDFLSYNVEQLMKNMSLARGLCRQYIFISSATVYDTKNGRYVEDDSIGNSEWEYAAEKAACERFLTENAKKFDFEYTIIRPYITYGKTRIPLQFAPLEYYTIIHRMKNGKCVPVFERDTACTLTTAHDFAVAAVGLLINKRAFGEAFHITGQYETTWYKVLLAEAKAFGTECDMVRVPKSIFRNHRMTHGIDVNEVLADKGRDMLFEQSKIRRVVPEFRGEQTLEEELPEIVDYFQNNFAARRINYVWDARVDQMLAASGLLTREQKSRLRYKPVRESGIRDRLTYSIHRHNPTHYACCALRKFAGTMKRICTIT